MSSLVVIPGNLISCHHFVGSSNFQVGIENANNDGYIIEIVRTALFAKRKGQGGDFVIDDDGDRGNAFFF